MTLARVTFEQRLAARADGDAPTGGWLCRLCDQSACGRAEGLCPAAEAAQQTLHDHAAQHGVD